MHDVVAQSLTFFTDGFETSSVIASFILYELTVNPDIQEALRAEVKAADSLTFNSVITMPLLERVFKGVSIYFYEFNKPGVFEIRTPTFSN